MRHILAFTLAMALAVGPSAHAAQAAHMSRNTGATVSALMPMSPLCNDCDEQHAMTPTQCAAYCASMVAVLPSSIAFDAIVIESSAHFAQPRATEHTEPPDPYPPRPAGLN